MQGQRAAAATQRRTRSHTLLVRWLRSILTKVHVEIVCLTPWLGPHMPLSPFQGTHLLHPLSIQHRLGEGFALLRCPCASLIGPHNLFKLRTEQMPTMYGA